ncbi:MAG: hypothetical protein JWM95_3678 [Gemmatimonadetes bacterium]|nr:hypothetical protein [Gemmatimonadota bacterium]
MPGDTHSGALTRCEVCGGFYLHGRRGCEETFHLISGAAQADARHAHRHRMVVDAYCLQHPDPYCLSAKSYAAHLVGLCWGVEHAATMSGYGAIQRWLNGQRKLKKPPLPPTTGSVTLAEVMFDSSQRRDDAVARWAKSVWQAHESQHAIARDWLTIALSEQQRSGRRAF